MELETEVITNYKWWTDDDLAIEDSDIILELDEEAEERIAEMVKEGYTSGELHRFTGEVNYIGAWSRTVRRCEVAITKEELVIQAKQILKDAGYFGITWTRADIENHEVGKLLTEKETDEVIKLVEHKFDAEQGINWGTIEYWIKEVLNLRLD